MQNKLNEILELCIEKSDKENGIFYEFKYNSYIDAVVITKWHNMSFHSEHRSMEEDLLEYMQNE